MSETLTFRVRDPKDLLQVSIEDSAAAGNFTSGYAQHQHTGQPQYGLSASENLLSFLARCSGAEGSPAPTKALMSRLFQSATAIVLQNYRSLLGARHTIPEEFARIAAYGRRPPKNRRKLL